MNEIKSRKNPLAVHIKKLGADGDYRRSHGAFVCDGEKLLREAVLNAADIKVVLSSGEAPEWLPKQIPFYKTEPDIINSVSPLKNPQSVVFICGIKERGEDEDIIKSRIILEGIQDPGNVGTILRTASAFNIGSVILTGGCADPYNPKTIRASMGAIFRQPVSVMDLDGIRMLKAKGIRLCGAALGEKCRDVREVTFKNTAVVIGSEGRGLTEEMLGLCDETIKIPMSPKSESLNAAVAAAIIMWEANMRTK